MFKCSCFSNSRWGRGTWCLERELMMAPSSYGTLNLLVLMLAASSASTITRVSHSSLAPPCGLGVTRQCPNLFGNQVNLFCSTGVHREQITANITGNALVMFDHGFVKGMSGRGCRWHIGCQATLRSHDREPCQSQRLI